MRLLLKFKRPFPHVTVFHVWRWKFFSPVWPNLFNENSHRKHIFSKTLSKVKIFENAGFSFCVDGRKWKFSNTMTSYIIEFYYYNITHALWGVLSYLHCLAFSYGWAKMIRVCYMWTRIFLKTVGENLWFQNYLDTCGHGVKYDILFWCSEFMSFFVDWSYGRTWRCKKNHGRKCKLLQSSHKVLILENVLKMFIFDSFYSLIF